MAITNTWSKADSVGRGYTLKLTVTETSVDVANNSSTLSWNLSLVSTSYNYRQFNTGFTVSIGGVTVASQTRDWNHQTSMGFNSTLVLSSGSRSFAHNADGTKTVACSASLDISSDYPGPGAISIAGGNLALTSIARESTISLNKTSLVAGEAVTWTVNKQNQSYTSTVTWAYGSKSGTIQTKSATASGTFTPDPSVLYSAGTSGTLTFSVTTWNGSTQVGGAKTASLTLSVKGPSTITATDANITAVSQLTVTRNHSTYTHSIYFERGSVHGYVTASGGVASSETRLTATSIGFTLPSSFYATIPNDKTGTVKLTVKTYYGSSGGQVGSAQTRNFTATAAESLCAPTIGTHTVVDINSATTALTGDSSKMVRGVSTARCTIAATAQNSATISKLIVNGSTVSSYKDIAQYNQANVVFEAVDSRGYSTKFTVTPTVIAYVLLTNYSKVIRPQPTDGSMRIQIRGDYWSGSFGSSSNSLTVKYRYREVGGSWNAYATVTPTVSGGKYSKDVDFPNGFDYQKSYEVEVYAADRLNTIAPTLTLMRGQPIADWGKDDFAIHGALEVYGNEVVEGVLDAYGASVARGGFTGKSFATNQTLRTYLHIVPETSYSRLGVASGYTNAFFSAYLAWVCANLPNEPRRMYMGIVNIDGSYQMVLFYIYNTADTQNGIPAYSSGIVIQLGTQSDTSTQKIIRRFGTYNYTVWHNSNST